MCDADAEGVWPGVRPEYVVGARDGVSEDAVSVTVARVASDRASNGDPANSRGCIGISGGLAPWPDWVSLVIGANGIRGDLLVEYALVGTALRLFWLEDLEDLIRLLSDARSFFCMNCSLSLRAAFCSRAG